MPHQSKRQHRTIATLSEPEGARRASDRSERDHFHFHVASKAGSNICLFSSIITLKQAATLTHASLSRGQPGDVIGKTVQHTSDRRALPSSARRLSDVRPAHCEATTSISKQFGSWCSPRIPTFGIGSPTQARVAPETPVASTAEAPMAPTDVSVSRVLPVNERTEWPHRPAPAGRSPVPPLSAQRLRAGSGRSCPAVARSVTTSG